MASRRPRSKAAAPKVAKEAKASIALSLRIEGMSYAAIAAQMGIAVSNAYNLVSDALAKLEAETAEKAAEIRRIEVDRLDAMLKALWPAVKQGEPRAIEVSLKTMERRSKLLGLDAPTKQEVSGPDGGAIPIEDARALLGERLAAIAASADAGAETGGTPRSS